MTEAHPLDVATQKVMSPEGRRQMFCTLKEKGYTWAAIGRRFGITGKRVQQVACGVQRGPQSAEYKAKRDRIRSERMIRRRVNDPAAHRDFLRRTAIRKAAREQAAETGEDVQALYAKWGVSDMPRGPRPKPIPADMVVVLMREVA